MGKIAKRCNGIRGGGEETVGPVGLGPFAENPLLQEIRKGGGNKGEMSLGPSAEGERRFKTQDDVADRHVLKGCKGQIPEWRREPSQQRGLSRHDR